MAPPEKPIQEGPQRLVWRGVVVLVAAVAIAAFTLAVAHGYVDANFPFLTRPLQWVGIGK